MSSLALTQRLELRREGAALQEVGIIAAITTPQSYPSLTTGQSIVQIDPRYFRPAEVETLLGDPSKPKADLGWIPEITLDEMVAEMVTHDLDLAKQHAPHISYNPHYAPNVTVTRRSPGTPSSSSAEKENHIW